MLFSPQEAEWVSQLPIKPFTVQTAARNWKLPLAQSQNILDGLASRAILVDFEENGKVVYALPPPMAGFFEFSLMRLRGDLDQRVLSELYYQYLNVEEDFIIQLFGDKPTKPGRVFVQEAALSSDHALHVLDYERASHVIRSASHRGIGICFCRHKMQHAQQSCGAPMDICMSFNGTAESLIRHDYARAVDVSEGLDLLQQAWENGLVQFGENARQTVSFICNCCACCCEAMIAARRFGFLHPVHTTNFILKVDPGLCNGCGNCISACPVEALGLVSAHDPGKPKRLKARLDEGTCLGCGVCVRSCPRGALALESRSERVITPLNSVHRIVLMAIERGKLQDLVFDNQVMWNHRALAAVLGVILRLPPIKQALASSQVRSRYLEALLARQSG
jgi:ferredoxin